jgi:hypothetical protein
MMKHVSNTFTFRAVIVVSAMILPHLALWIYDENRKTIDGLISPFPGTAIVISLFSLGGLAAACFVFRSLKPRFQLAAAISISFLVGISLVLLNVGIGLVLILDYVVLPGTLGDTG